jgi:hypothetical protein
MQPKKHTEILVAFLFDPQDKLRLFQNSMKSVDGMKLGVASETTVPELISVTIVQHTTKNSDMLLDVMLHYLFIGFMCLFKMINGSRTVILRVHRKQQSL